MPRQKDEPGKGGFWKIDPQYAERLFSSAYKKRRMPPVQINPALQNHLRVCWQPQSVASAVGPVGLCPNLDSQKLLRVFEEVTGDNQNWDPHLAMGNMLESWPIVRGRSGHKRKKLLASKNGTIKALQRSSSPLLFVDEQKEVGPLKGHFDWDYLLDSALGGGLSLDGGELLSPITKAEEATVSHVSLSEALVETEDRRNSNVSDFDEETFLATAFLEMPSPEEEQEVQGHGDFLCTSTVNLDQLFDLGDSLNVDSRIDTLL